MNRIKTYLLLSIVIIAGICFNQYCFSQGMINDGATITITTGAIVYIDGDASGKYTNQTNAGSDGKIDLNGDLYVEGDWINNATSNNVFINNAAAPWGTVYLNGTVASNVTGSRLTEFENLYVQNANRTLLITDCEVNNILTVANTGLILNQKRFIIDNNLSAGITAVGTGHIRSESTFPPFGEIQWNIGSATATNYIIPFATVAPVLIPFSFNPNAGTTGNLVVATYPTNPANVPYPPGVTNMIGLLTGIDNSALTVDRFWEIVVPGALASANVSFRCTAAEAAGIPNPRAQRWRPPFSAWEFPYQGAQVTAAIGTDVTGMTAHNTWWTLADITSPLPVELLSFNIVCNNKTVELSWTTASESENKYFTIEKSKDGKNFESLLRVNGTGNSTSLQTYYAKDNHPYGDMSYYQLKQTDYNGMESLVSGIYSVKHCGLKNDFSVTVVSSSISSVSLLINAVMDEKFDISIFDATGRILYSKPAYVTEGFNEIKLNTANLSNSVYFVHLNGTEHTISEKVMLIRK